MRSLRKVYGDWGSLGVRGVFRRTGSTRAQEPIQDTNEKSIGPDKMSKKTKYCVCLNTSSCHHLAGKKHF